MSQPTPNMTALGAQITSSMTMKDIAMICKGCSSEFKYTLAQQELHERKGHTSTPTWCPACKPKRACHQFTSTGQCNYGDTCLFSHGETERSVSGQRLQEELPGQYDKICKNLDTCKRGDMCVFTHPGREAHQKMMAANTKHIRSENSGVPLTGFHGLTKRA
jgi:hypothetical protein